MKTFMLALLLLAGGVANANTCYESTIRTPAPFMGNNDEVFVLTDGTVWQVKFEYEYLYAYYPNVIICPDTGKLIVLDEGEQHALDVERIR